MPPGRSRTTASRSSIAPSFGDIFATNCFKIGLVTIVAARRAGPPADAGGRCGGVVEVDLERQLIVDPTGREIAFEFDPFQRECLLEGLDEIARSLADLESLEDYEASHPPRVDTRALAV